MRTASVAPVDNAAARIELFKQDIVSRTVVVVDDHLVRAGIKRGTDRRVHLVRQQLIHPVTVPDILLGGIRPVFAETESGDAFNIRLNIDFHSFTLLQRR